TCEAGIPACQSTTGTGGTSGTGGSTGSGGSSGGGWTCEDQPAQGTTPGVCVCLQMTGGTLSTCPSTYDCCFTFVTQGTTSCSCTTTAGTGATCAQLASALGGTVK